MKRILLIFLIAAIFGGCIPQKKIIYVQPPGKSADSLSLKQSPIKIKPNDELYVNLSSLTGTDNTNMNPLNTAGGGLAQSDITMVSYTVNDQGYINLPIIGNFNVKDKTIEEISIELQDTLKTYIEQPYVSVKLLNKTITVLGEVGLPGRYQFSGAKISIFSALGMAGDISTYGNRQKVLVMREAESGMMKRYVDLTNNLIYTSDVYYLQPNDIVYVQPFRTKFWGMRVTPFTAIMSGITTYLLFYGLTNNNAN